MSPTQEKYKGRCLPRRASHNINIRFAPLARGLLCKHVGTAIALLGAYCGPLAGLFKSYCATPCNAIGFKNQTYNLNGWNHHNCTKQASNQNKKQKLVHRAIEWGLRRLRVVEKHDTAHNFWNVITMRNCIMAEFYFNCLHAHIYMHWLARLLSHIQIQQVQRPHATEGWYKNIMFETIRFVNTIT